MNWSQTDPKLLATITDGSLLGKLLDNTKGQSTITLSQLPEWIKTSKWFSSMETAGILQPLLNQQWQISGTAKVQVAMHAIRLGQPERQILDSLTWQEFEEFVSAIFDRHNFTINLRYRFTVNRRYEIDVIATRRPVLFCIDCKHYGVRLGKASTLRNAVKQQIERTQELATHFAAHQTKLKCLGWHKVMFIPLLVTMLNEDLIFHEKVPIVPASQLNAFILDYDKAIDKLLIVTPPSDRQYTLEDV